MITLKMILNFLTWIVFGLFWVSLVTIDCVSWTPFIVCMVCWIWLAVAAWRKGWYYKEDEDNV